MTNGFPDHFAQIRFVGRRASERARRPAVSGPAADREVQEAGRPHHDRPRRTARRRAEAGRDTQGEARAARDVPRCLRTAQGRARHRRGDGGAQQGPALRVRPRAGSSRSAQAGRLLPDAQQGLTLVPHLRFPSPAAAHAGQARSDGPGAGGRRAASPPRRSATRPPRLRATTSSSSWTPRARRRRAGWYGSPGSSRVSSKPRQGFVSASSVAPAATDGPGAAGATDPPLHRPYLP